jgi:hypothetical protein
MPGFEIHFGQGFRGEHVRLRSGARILFEGPLRTRPQVGAAHVERIDLPAGEKIVVEIPASGAEAGITLDPGFPYVLVEATPHGLSARTTAQQPRYL